ncbi:hypothetical protein LT330_009625 [Penicillium expansum]|nr:hypothetical protein LT330_009625 [Penicillium expansum]
MKSFRGPVNGHLPGPGTSVQGRQKRGQPASSEGAALERKRIKKSQCMFTDSTWYTWYLVCESLCWPEYSSLMAYKLNKSFVCQETKTDLASLCLVSKAMNDLATPFLYRSISLRMLEETLEDKLIERLPNLRQVRLELACDFSSNYMKSIDEHPQKPELHLLAGGWGKPCPRPLPRVTEIRVMWGTECEMRGEQRPLHQPDNFLNYITSCPNLKSCSWVAGNPKETVIGEPPNDIEGSVIHKPFPFLEHLDLYQYYIGTQMWHGWEDHFNWSSLSSLEIGQGLFARENLNVMTGRLSNLKRFKITGNDVQNEELCRSLETFLVAFDTLVDLELLNCFVPIHAITRHTRLANLCVHIIDTWSCLDSRTVFESEDLISLDALCPQLENLQLDIERDNEKEDWVCVFPNLVNEYFTN